MNYKTKLQDNPDVVMEYITDITKLNTYKESELKNLKLHLLLKRYENNAMDRKNLFTLYTIMCKSDIELAGVLNVMIGEWRVQKLHSYILRTNIRIGILSGLIIYQEDNITLKERKVRLIMQRFKKLPFIKADRTKTLGIYSYTLKYEIFKDELLSAKKKLEDGRVFTYTSGSR